MLQVVMGAMGIFVGLATLIIAAGWIVPLILGIIGRRRHWPSARGLWILAVVWGGTAVLLAFGISGLVFTVSRMGRSYESNARLFNATAYGGKTAILRLAYTGEAECVIQDQAGKNFRCATTNGSLVVPAGDLTIHECKFMASDAALRPWTASCRFGDEIKISVGTDAVQNVAFGPPLLVAVQAEYTPVSSKIRLEPACADRAGNIYTISGAQKDSVPSFQFLDAKQQVIWNGKFEAG